MDWLRTVVVAAHGCISELGGAGVRVVGQFLDLSGLSAFVGAAYGSQQAFHAELEQQIIAGAAEQRAQLAQDMPHRTLTLAEDETWRGGMRLVALAPVSGFILVEAGRRVALVGGLDAGPGARARWTQRHRGARYQRCSQGVGKKISDSISSNCGADRPPAGGLRTAGPR
ncbi:MAG: hypothetical protein KAX58_10115 [Aeromonadaceae bacterium]|nr:hypothetical protein [Aeromonadaceae bacterium]